jgi:hypothetical protein
MEATTETLTDNEILTQIDLIEENMQECGRQSSYTKRNRPFLKALYIEAARRNLDVPS